MDKKEFFEPEVKVIKLDEVMMACNSVDTSDCNTGGGEEFGGDDF